MIIDINSASLSRMICATTKIGQMHSPGGIAAATEAELGTAPAADLCIAAVRRYAAVIEDEGLRDLCNQLDEMLDQ